LLHYVAVNARTKETMGSVPIHMPKLFLVSFLVEILGIIAMLFVDFDNNWIFALAGIIYFFIFYAKYRNSNARHNYESETKSNMENLSKYDNLIQRRTGLTNPRIQGANNTSVSGQSTGRNMLDMLTEQNQFAGFIKKVSESSDEQENE
jgi:hypothetical protein